ncbi:MAG: hypothetical protein Q7S53_03990 [bacterium]|nr:hypothetical protein [bacterium]
MNDLTEDDFICPKCKTPLLQKNLEKSGILSQGYNKCGKCGKGQEEKYVTRSIDLEVMIRHWLSRLLHGDDEKEICHFWGHVNGEMVSSNNFKTECIKNDVEIMGEAFVVEKIFLNIIRDLHGGD